jgi:DDE superfamily endonuclease
MTYNFLRCDRDQPFLLPPDLRDWLPDGHLAWFILDVTDQVDLEPFYRAHRNDGHGHPAYDPKLLVGVLLYGYCLGVRSSRQLANCQLGVSVNAITEHASCPLDWRLFLPEGWDEPAMAARRAACHLPERVHHRPKWQLVVDLLDELGGWDLGPPVLLADSGYGEVGEFRGGLDARGVPDVVEVRSDTSAHPEHVHPVAAPYSGKGRRPRPRYHHPHPH